MNRTSKIALLALAIAPLCATAAQAETIYLKCMNDGQEFGTFPVDLANNTAQGKPAVITPVAIDWDNNNQYGDAHMHIDRAAGTFFSSGVAHTRNGDMAMPPTQGSCTAVAAPATKF